MARKPTRRQFRRPRPQQRTEDAASSRRRLEAAAQSLLSTTTAEQLSQELSAREWRLTEADRVVQLDPNPGNLSRYRFARSQYEAAQAAVGIASRRAPDAPPESLRAE